MTFLNRVDAGRQLADVLRGRHPIMPLIVGLTKGGVPVAAELARTLHAPFDICVVRKLLAPSDPAIVIGAIAEGGATYIDPERVAMLGIAAEELEAVVARETLEVARLSALFRDRPPIEARGCDVILVDDGVLGVGPLRAAARAFRRRGVYSLELAVPVGAKTAIDALHSDFDRVTCLDVDPFLSAIGARYAEFWPVSDAEVMDALAAGYERVPRGAGQATARP